MYKQKQIEEMAKDIGNSITAYKCFCSSQLNNCGSIKNCLHCIIATNLIAQGYRKINIDKLKRIFVRNYEEFEILMYDEKNLSKYGQHNLGYVKGRLSLLEDLFYELDFDFVRKNVDTKEK